MLRISYEKLMSNHVQSNIQSFMGLFRYESCTLSCFVIWRWFFGICFKCTLNGEWSRALSAVYSGLQTDNETLILHNVRAFVGKRGGWRSSRVLHSEMNDQVQSSNKDDTNWEHLSIAEKEQDFWIQTRRKGGRHLGEFTQKAPSKLIHYS